MEAAVLKIAAILSLIFLLTRLYYRNKKVPLPIPAKGIDATPFCQVDLIFCGLLIGFFYLKLLFAPSNLGSEDSTVAPSLSLLIVGKAVTVLPAVFVLMRLGEPKFSSILNWKTKFSFTNFVLLPIGGVILVLAFAYFFALSGLQTALSEWLNAKGEQNVIRLLTKGPWDVRIFIVFSSIIIAPVVEELIFRGYLYPVLKKFGGTVTSLVFTSLLFALVHNHIIAAIPLTVFAMLMVFLYERTRTIWVPIITHCLFNTLTVTVNLISTIYT